MKNLINFRGFVSLLTAFSFVFTFLSGVILYFAPQGRIAYWTNWKFLTLTKTDWTNIHIIFCIVFMITTFFHVYYNWNALLNYIYSKAKKAFNLKKELTIIIFLLSISIIGSLKLFPPFNLIIDLSEFLKSTWIKNPDYEPPFGHAELLSLEDFSNRRNIDLQQAVMALKQKNVKFESVRESLGLIAKKNGLSPMQIYEILKPLEGKTLSFETRSKENIVANKTTRQVQNPKWTKEEIISEFEGKGIGRKTLKQICEENKLDVSVIIRKLKNNGINAKDKDTMREIAEKNGTNPIDILIQILMEENKPQR